jgi:hypothetical protein
MATCSIPNSLRQALLLSPLPGAGGEASRRAELLEERMTSVSVLVAGALLAAAVPLAAQAPGDPPGLLGLDAATTKLMADSYAAARSETLEAMLRIARNAQLQALERNPPDFVALINAMEVEKTVSANLLSRRLNATLDAYMRMTPDQRRAVVASSRRMQAEMDKLRADGQPERR